MRLIGLSGFAQAGKDTAAGVLLERGWTRVAFADAIRDFALALDPIVPDVDPEDPSGCVYSHARLSEYVDALGWDLAKQAPEVRRTLQRLGCEAGHGVLGDRVWIDAAMAKVSAAGADVVVTDVRFVNEAEAIWRAGGVMLRVERPGTVSVNAHASEHALEGFLFDEVLVNDGTPGELGVKVLAVVRGM